MDSSYIHEKFSNAVLTITLNRPDKLNSFTEKMAGQLQTALKKAGEEQEIRCVLLTASGRAFCAGQDLKEAKENDKRNGYVLGDTVCRSYNPIVKAIRQLEKPVIAAVNGTAAGAGANLALACDIIMASGEAKFIQSFSRIGLIPDSGGTFLLPKLLGFHRAMAAMLLAEPMTAEEAKKAGIVYKTVSADYLLAEATELAERLAEGPTRSFGLIKRAVNQSFSNSFDRHLELEAELQTEAGKTDDYHEGVTAFLEKRKPLFKGR